MEDAAMKVALMVDLFQKVKKRLPQHLREVRDCIEGLGYPVELEEFHELKLEALSQRKLLVEYSVFTGEDEWTPSRKLEMTSFSEDLAKGEGVLSKLKLESFDKGWVEELCFS
jgi:lipoate-protein ligase A